VAPIDLSKAKKLKRVLFRVSEQFITWVTVAVKTVTSEHKDLQHISIHIFTAAPHGTEVHRQWMDLDRHLVMLCELRGIRVKFSWGETEGKEPVHIETFLPEVTRKGLVDAG
jgi:hypothetical protein